MTDLEQRQTRGELIAPKERGALAKTRTGSPAHPHRRSACQCRNLPDILFIVDVQPGVAGVTEANKLHIPVVAMV